VLDSLEQRLALIEKTTGERGARVAGLGRPAGLRGAQRRQYSSGGDFAFGGAYPSSGTHHQKFFVGSVNAPTDIYTPHGATSKSCTIKETRSRTQVSRNSFSVLPSMHMTHLEAPQLRPVPGIPFSGTGPRISLHVENVLHCASRQSPRPLRA
jgi:hypothetical protein